MGEKQLNNDQRVTVENQNLTQQRISNYHIH